MIQLPGLNSLFRAQHGPKIEPIFLWLIMAERKWDRSEAGEREGEETAVPPPCPSGPWSSWSWVARDGAWRRPSKHLPWQDKHCPGTFYKITHPHFTQRLKGKDPFYRGATSDGKESACSAGDPGSIPGSGRSPGEENGNLLQYSGLQNSMNRGAWQATVHGVSKSQT